MGATTDYSKSATIVCVDQVRSHETSEGWGEVNISLSASNFANTITTNWPTDASDCVASNYYGREWDSNVSAYIPYCQFAGKGGAAQKIKSNKLCTILYDSDYNLGIDIREVDGGEDDDYSMMTVRPRSFHGLDHLQVRVKEDEGGVATKKSSCANFTASANAGVSVDSNVDDVFSGSIPVNPVSNLFKKEASASNCKKWVDTSELGVWVVDLHITRPGDSDFDSLYRSLSYKLKAPM